jgi:putative FmdB family regulatory protein
MPTYDYDCADCGHEFEQFQSMSSASLEICPKCGGKVKRRMHGGAGLIFKGSGFYLTDYKKPSPSTPSTGSGAEGRGEKSAGDSAKKADGDTAKKEGKAQNAGDKKGTEEKSDSKTEKKEKTTE